jgi:hypothetical protein
MTAKQRVNIREIAQSLRNASDLVGKIDASSVKTLININITALEMLADIDGDKFWEITASQTGDCNDN